MQFMAKIIPQQECIPVRCKPSAVAAVSGGGGVSAGGVSAWGCVSRGGGYLPTGCLPRDVCLKGVFPGVSA